MATTFADLPGWRFTIDEISAGVYQVLGVDETRRSVQLQGQDPDELLRRCHAQAIAMTSR